MSESEIMSVTADNPVTTPPTHEVESHDVTNPSQVTGLPPKPPSLKRVMNFDQTSNHLASGSGGSNELRPEFAEPDTDYTLQPGITLYHGSNTVQTFNPQRIKLGDGNKLTGAIFSARRSYAENRTSNCANYPPKSGYVHRFITTEPIWPLRVVSSLEFTNTKATHLEGMYCNTGINGNRYRGIISFFPAKDGAADGTGARYESEIFLCSAVGLEYQGTTRCASHFQWSQEYKFDDVKPAVVDGYPGAVF